MARQIIIYKMDNNLQSHFISIQTWSQSVEISEISNLFSQPLPQREEACWSMTPLQPHPILHQHPLRPFISSHFSSRNERTCSRPGVSGNSRSRPAQEWEPLIPFPELWEWIFLFPFCSRNLEMFFFIPFPFPNYGNGFFSFPSRSRIVGMDFFHSLPVPELWEWIFLIPFPFPNLLFHRRESKRELDYCNRYQASNFFSFLYISQNNYIEEVNLAKMSKSEWLKR